MLCQRLSSVGTCPAVIANILCSSRRFKQCLYNYIPTASLFIIPMHEAGEGSNAVWQPNTSTADSRTPLANDLTLDNRLNPETDVMLRVECMSSRALKARLTSILVSTQTYTKTQLMSSYHVAVFLFCTFNVSLQAGCKHWWSSLLLLLSYTLPM